MERVLKSPATWIAYAAVVGIAIGVNHLLGAMCGLAPLVVWLLFTKSSARVLAVVGGGLLVLGSSSDVGPAKVIYAGVLLSCAAVSAVRLIQVPVPWMAPFRKLIGWGLVLIVCMLLGTLFIPGANPVAVIRSGLFYLMIPLAPIIGIDAGRDMKNRRVLAWIGVIGCIAAVGFATDWLDRRGVSNLDFGRFILSSLAVPALGFSLSVVSIAFSTGWKRILWAIPMLLIPVAMLVTGTRTNLIIFAALFGVVGLKRHYRLSLPKLIAVGGAGATAALLLIPLVGKYLLSNETFLDARMRALGNVVEGNASADGSFMARSKQYAFAWDTIWQSPLFGFGPGFKADISLDTPLSTVVKLGFVGTFVLIAFFVVMFLIIRQTAKMHGHTVIHTAAFGVAFISLAWLPFGSPVEDRGYGFMLVLLFMALTASIRDQLNDGLARERYELSDSETGESVQPSSQTKYLKYIRRG